MAKAIAADAGNKRRKMDMISRGAPVTDALEAATLLSDQGGKKPPRDAVARGHRALLPLTSRLKADANRRCLGMRRRERRERALDHEAAQALRWRGRRRGARP
eukprot:885395-Pleurochrysis_carterae.AAC.2